MAKKVLPLHLNEGDYFLRLTVGGQKALKKKFGENALEVVLDAVSDLEKICAVLTEALSWAGNPNDVTDGEAFYDLLVDNDYSGMSQFMGLMCDILVCSGMLTEQQAEAVKVQLIGQLDHAFDELSGVGETQPGGEDRPTMTAD